MSAKHGRDTDWLSPLEVCERLIGPISEIARVCEVSSQAPFQWRHPSNLRDAGDLPTPRYQRLLLRAARARGLPLEARHLIEGASVAEIARLMPPPVVPPEPQPRPEPLREAS